MKKIANKCKALILNANLKKTVLHALSVTLLIGTLVSFTSQVAHAAGGDKHAYNCAVQALKSGDAAPDVNSLTASCIGNSHDPGKSEIQGFKDAIADFRKQKSATSTLAAATSQACPFGYAVYEANGSRADNFLEGPQKIHSMKTLARLWGGRTFTVYDSRGVAASKDLLDKLFYISKKNPDGSINELGLTNYALKNCSKKQIGTPYSG